ncbi:hypothetical protein K501DRAFT_280671 [Backusella circina FSU 941]|nr:hypothetical protein K501DRAFT_280671 [Backusella circina FSU 941]
MLSFYLVITTKVKATGRVIIYKLRDDNRLTYASIRKTYTTYLPNIIIGLSTFYVLILCIKLFLKQRGRYIDKLYRKEKQRLREKWEHTLNQDNNTVYGDDDNKRIFIERPKTAYTQKSSSYAHSAPYLTFDNTLQDDCSVTVAHTYPNSAIFELAHPNPSDSTLINAKVIGQKIDVLDNDKRTINRSLFKYNYYWKMRKSKRLDLLWQWSVSMGYCRYEYGRRLDDKIAELQEKQSVYYNKGENSLT